MALTDKQKTFAHDDSVVIIIGSGAGGGTLANGLAQQGIDTVVLEAGQLHTTADFLADEDAASLARFSDILLLGHDWVVDEELLLGLLKARQADPDSWGSRIGVIGSRSKWQEFAKSAQAAGIDAALLDDVDCPIGLNIGAESPAEIAVAVTAQLISRIKEQDHESPNWRERQIQSSL